MIILAFIVGYFANQMCGRGLIEGVKNKVNERCNEDDDCESDLVCSTSNRHATHIVDSVVPYVVNLVERLLNKFNIEYKCVRRPN
tara:strand:- start:228 stop:482 length:255 start_codon:yes stop_codon:yes gene_type:complete